MPQGKGHTFPRHHSIESTLDVTVHRIPIDSLTGSDSPRSQGTDMRHVAVLAETADVLPPIVVHRRTMCVIDGMHRLQALQIRGCTTIDVRYFHGSLQEAFLIAVESNIGHGLPLSLSDRKKAVLRIIQTFPDRSDRYIASLAGVDHKTVGAIRRTLQGDIVQSTVRIGMDGKQRPVNPASGRAVAERAIVEDPQISLRDIAKLSGISAETARHVRTKVKRNVVPAKARRRDSEPVVPGMGVVTALESLRRDPAVRYNGERRALLGWLEARLVSESDTRRLTRMPAHQMVWLAAVTRDIATRWSRVAEQLERQIPRDQ